MGVGKGPGHGPSNTKLQDTPATRDAVRKAMMTDPSAYRVAKKLALPRELVITIRQGLFKDPTFLAELEAFRTTQADEALSVYAHACERVHELIDSEDEKVAVQAVTAGLKAPAELARAQKKDAAPAFESPRVVIVHEAAPPNAPQIPDE